MKDYHINIFYSDDGGYIADIPDLRQCSAVGETPEEALAEVLKAKAPSKAVVPAGHLPGRIAPPLWPTVK